MQSLLPGLSVLNNYVRAVRYSDGAIFDSTTSVNPGGAYATSNPIAVTIGGVTAEVLWVGLVRPGLYRINVVAPARASGGQPGVATVAGMSTQTGALVKVAA